MNELQILVFKLNKEICAVETEQVREISQYKKATKMPRTSKIFEGIVILRDITVPVVNLNKRFDQGETEITENTKVIFAEVNEQIFGFIVNDILEIITLPEEEIERDVFILEKCGSSYLKGIGRNGEQIISILDLNSILTKKEISKVKNEKVDINSNQPLED